MEEAADVANPYQDARDGNGRYVRTPQAATRDAQAADLRAQGWTYQRIADHLGYTGRSDARQAILRAIKDITQEPAEAVLHFELERLDAELARLDELEAAVRKVLGARHITVSNGRVILHPDTEEPMEDDGPVLHAVDRLLKIEEARRRNGERRAKLCGLETLKLDATVHQVTEQDRELQELLREARAKMQAEEQHIVNED
ncbi:hypothetical protein ABZ733_07020 [Streptomyces longwoodensis]|uniref:hypothetical protein n=1 Tax=Streptomyces longwoodensis TaxID=68231 RepID=UPI0033ECFCBC